MNIVKKTQLKYTRHLNLMMGRLNALTRKSNLSHLPSYMMLEPTNFCNLKCPLCPTGRGSLDVPRGYMDYSEFEKLILDTSHYLDTLLLWGFGEPLLHPDISSMVKFASSMDIKTKISTNGQCFGSIHDCHKLVDSGLTQLRVSLDGLSDEVLQVYRKGASFDSILEGLNYIIERKKAKRSNTPHIILQFILMGHNQHELPKLKRLANSLRVGWRVKTVSIGCDASDMNDSRFLPALDRSRYKSISINNNKMQLVPKRTKPKICPYPWFWLHVNWDGSVVPCCKDPHRQHFIGNVFDCGVKEIWNNREFSLFRKNYLLNPLMNNRCKRCDLHLNK